MLKQPATYAEQIAKLREHGCVVSDEAFCEEILSQVSYYRLSAYFLPFRMADGKYRSGTEFSRVYRFYELDRKLRSILFLTVEEIEVFLRAQFSYYHAHKYGSDGYTDAINFNSRHDHGNFMARVAETLKNNDKVTFVQHHMNKYNGDFPIWVLMELFTFGMLSYFYADLTICDQKQLAKDMFGTVPKNIKSWLHCCTVLRNICAHYGRLYYRVFTAIPAGLPEVDKAAERKLFAAIMALRQLYPNIGKWNNEILPSIAALIEQYTEVIDLRHIGFPENWEDIIQK